MLDGRPRDVKAFENVQSSEAFADFLQMECSLQDLRWKQTVKHGGARCEGALEDGLVGGAVLEANGVPDLGAQLAADLGGHARRHAHGRHAPRLRAPDAPRLAVPRLMQVLRNLHASSATWSM